MTKKHGFQKPTPDNPDDSYNSYCWFMYPAISPTGELCGTVKELFPPMMQNHTYGEKTVTEIRGMAMDRLNSLHQKYGTEEVKVEML